jgi:hypothetical protein
MVMWEEDWSTSAFGTGQGDGATAQEGRINTLVHGKVVRCVAVDQKVEASITKRNFTSLAMVRS